MAVALPSLAQFLGVSMQTQAAILRHVGDPITVASLDLAPPRAGEVLVRIAAAGVCHSD